MVKSKVHVLARKFESAHIGSQSTLNNFHQSQL